MNKSHLKKRSNLKNLKCKEYRQMNFVKNSIILRKNESFRHVYLLKSGEAGIFAENDSSLLLHRYKEGDCLNSIEICMGMSSFKTIKAITRCQILLMVWNKEHQDEQKKNVFIPRIEELKVYEIPVFKNLAYGLMLELIMHFKKDVVPKMQITTFFKNKLNCTCFVIGGSLTLESLSRQSYDSLKQKQNFQPRQSRKSLLQQKNLKLLKFQTGEMLYLDPEHKYQYVCESQKCEIIYIFTDLLYYFLSPECTQKIKQLKEFQRSNIVSRQSKTYKALKTMSRSINRLNSRSEFIPQRFYNPIEKKCEKFEKARSVHYTKNNRNFRSYSEQKKRILQERDKGYKEISQLNRRKYGRNYICQKRMEISRHIHGDNAIFTNEAIRNSESEGGLMRRGVTVYESVTLKDDYGIIKQSPLMKFIKSNRLRQSKNKTSHQAPVYKHSKNQKEIQNLTLKSVEKIRRNFQDNSKTLLKNYVKKDMQIQL